MTGIRTYTTLDPNIWRFPQWKDNVFYPAGTFVAQTTYNPVDSEDVTFAYYVSTKDVDIDTKKDSLGNVIVGGGSWQPGDSDSDWINHSTYVANPWALAFDTTADVINADVIASIAALNALFPLIGIDSDVAVLQRADSDFTVKDSEQDSDILQTLHHALASDSDYYVIVTAHLDSEELARQSADSDLQVQIWDNDSDILMEIHDRKAADSDLQIQIWDNDSDIKMEIHDRKGADSDIRVDVDSDILVLHVRADSDSDRLTNFIHDYVERDSDIELKFDQHDSDIAYLYASAASVGNTGFPVGSIVQFATTNMPIGFALCDGSTFDQLAYPDLFTMLGGNSLPDLRGQFIRGWSTDNSVDPDGPRAALSVQQDAYHEHNHQWHEENAGSDGRLDAVADSFESATYQENGVNYRSIGGNEFYGDAWTSTTRDLSSGAQETRPKNTALVFGIALYNGAGIVYDSDIFESILTIRLRDYDSDLNVLYSRTDFHTETFAATSNSSPGLVHPIAVDSSLYDDIEVQLNGVAVSQWTASGTNITLNFTLRKNIDVVTFKLRR